ncbi:MAG: class II aldolase/adducin family protein [Chromatiales bacterium]|nr:class II aldolase/adducin family protein [Chromatiales bacterium]
MSANPSQFQAASATIDSIQEAKTEAELRVQLAGAYRLVDYFGWTELIYGHLTVRVPGPDPHFLINPYGLNYDEICASNLVKIDVDGNVVEPTDYAINAAGFVIHSAVHMANSDDNKCVMHTHTRAGMAICAIEEGLEPISMFATAFYNRLAFHEYEGPSLDIGERERLLENLGDNRAMLLRNHGLLAVGRTIPETFLRLYRLERACQVQLDAAAAGTLRRVPGQVAELSGRGIDKYSDEQTNAGIGSLEYAAMLRKLDRLDSSYRH